MSVSAELETGYPPYPYPGLRPFGSKEGGIFFGRDEQVDELSGMLEENRLLAVVGPSGCGKSSLVRAGLIPALNAGYMASAGFRWDVAVMRPGNQPLRNLARALIEGSILAAESASPEEDEAFLRATLRRGPLGLVEAIKHSGAEGQNLLLVVDQFEEIFRFEKSGDPSEARAFVDLLIASANAPEVTVYVVITMRSDFLGNCLIFAGLPEAMNNSQFLTPRLTREQIGLAIECPLSLFDADIEPAVVNRTLNEVGTDLDQLPLMQHLLLRMWRRASQRLLADKRSGGVTLSLEDYELVGGLKGALSSHVEKTYNNLCSDQQKVITEAVFRRLTDITPEGHIVRRPTSISDICKSAALDETEVVSVIDVFRAPGRSFLMPSSDQQLTSTTLVDISHESLIRNWERLKMWIEDESKARRIEKMLKAGATRWQKEGRGEDADVERSFVLTGVDLEEAREWASSHARELDQPEWELAHEFLEVSESYRDEAVREAEAAKHASELAEKNEEYERTIRAKNIWLVVMTSIAILSTCVAIGLFFR